MKLLSTLLLGFALLTSLPVCAHSACACEDCGCTQESGCGCEAGEGCTCSPE